MPSHRSSCRQSFLRHCRPRNALLARSRSGRNYRSTCHIASPNRRMRSRDRWDKEEDRGPYRLCRSRDRILESPIAFTPTPAVPTRLLHLREWNGDRRLAVLKGRSERKAEIPGRGRNALVGSQNGSVCQFRFLPAGSALLIVRVQFENVAVGHFVLWVNQPAVVSRHTHEAFSCSYDPNTTSKKRSP